MFEIIYRDAVIDDIPGMVRLWREYWREQPYESNLRSKIEVDTDLVYVAEVDRQIVGTIIGGFDGWRGWMYRLAVMSNHQNRGIATHLIKEMQRRLKSRGAKSISGMISPSNEKMYHILRKMGYSEREDRRLSIRL